MAPLLLLLHHPDASDAAAALPPVYVRACAGTTFEGTNLTDVNFEDALIGRWVCD